MNKSHYRVVLMMLLSVQAAFGWVIRINNQTQYKAHLEIAYEVCNSDFPEIPAGAIVDLEVKACRVEWIRGALVTVPGDSSKNLSIELWQPMFPRRDFSIAIVKSVRYLAGHKIEKYEVNATKY